MTRLRTRPESQRLAGDASIQALSVAAFDSLPYLERSRLEEYLQGVFGGRAQPVEKYTDVIYSAYAPVRRAILSAYGLRVHLYRGEPVVPPRIQRRFLSWTPLHHMAGRFAEDREFNVVAADVATSDIVAAIYRGKYVEFLVADRPEYHVQRSSVPMLGGVFFDTDYNRPIKPQAAALARELRRALQTVGGRVIHVTVDEVDNYANASVLLPAEVARGAESLRLAGFLIEGLQPYSGNTWSR